MNRILVIADDLTGAAEIAGIGRRFGLGTALFREPVAPPPGAGLFVYDTDSRGLSPADAASRVASFAAAAGGQFDLVYKKCDSLLRGPVAAEVAAIMRALRQDSSILLPQNPSRGRTIDAHGVYRIDGAPIDQTEFAHDPDDPADTAVAAELLARRSGGLAAGLLIRLHPATHAQDVLAAAGGVKPGLLPAGGADFFTALLQVGGHAESPPATQGRLRAPKLLISGSGSRQTSETIVQAIADGDAVSRMPSRLFASRGTDAPGVASWAEEIAALLAVRPRVLVAIDRPVTRDRQLSTRLTGILAELAGVLVRRMPIGALLLEGGATASGVCRRMAWNQFEVVAELAPGVVSLAPQSNEPAPVLIVKPGSYPWPAFVWPGNSV